eukprot:1139318-Pelagomonas_calceolata.AAC.3
MCVTYLIIQKSLPSASLQMLAKFLGLILVTRAPHLSLLKSSAHYLLKLCHAGMEGHPVKLRPCTLSLICSPEVRGLQELCRSLPHLKYKSCRSFIRPGNSSAHKSHFYLISSSCSSACAGAPAIQLLHPNHAGPQVPLPRYHGCLSTAA